MFRVGNRQDSSVSVRAERQKPSFRGMLVHQRNRPVVIEHDHRVFGLNPVFAEIRSGFFRSHSHANSHPSLRVQCTLADWQIQTTARCPRDPSEPRPSLRRQSGRMAGKSPFPRARDNIAG